jgi:hypothetical protein
MVGEILTFGASISVVEPTLCIASGLINFKTIVNFENLHLLYRTLLTIRLSGYLFVIG